MLSKGPARKVVVYVNEQSRHHSQPLWSAVFDFLRHKAVAGATVTHARWGFGARHRVHNAESPEQPEAVIRIECIDSLNKIDEILPTLYDMVTDGLIEVQDTTVVKAASPAIVAARAPRLRKEGDAKEMRIFLGEADRRHGEPLFDAIVKRLRMMDIAGATVYRGILGYGGRSLIHKQKFLGLSSDLPIMISVMDAPEKIARAVPVVEEMPGNGLITLSAVHMVNRVRESEQGHGVAAG